MNWEKLGKIAAGIDGGCSACICRFTEDLLKEFPCMDWDAYLRGIAGDSFHCDEYTLEELQDLKKERPS